MRTKHDTKGRRKFASHSGRVIRGHQPSPAERQWLSFLNVHGLASSELLYELTRDKKGVRNRHNFSEKLLRLWEAGLVSKPMAQRATECADNNFHIYDLSEKGREYLKREGLWVEALRPSGNFAHGLMVAYITGTIDIMCRRHRYHYIPPHEYLADNPLKAEVPFAWEDGRHTGPLVPDAVFAIDYGNHSFIAYALEADRNTEPVRAKRWQRKSDLRTIRQYKSFIADRQYQQAYGRQADMMLLYVTVSKGHAETFLELVAEELDSPTYIAVGVLEAFKTPFRPSKMPGYLFEGPLARVGRDGWTLVG